MGWLISHVIIALTSSIIIGLTTTPATAGPHMEHEDLMFSYAPGTDQVVFGGVSYTTSRSDQEKTPSNKSTLYSQDLKTGVKTKVYEITGQYLGNPRVSPSGKVVAVQASQDERFHIAQLLVLTADGGKIASFAQGREFSWSPDSRFLAYTTGDLKQTYTLQSSGTWLYDQLLKTSTQIHDKGHFVAWSQNGHNLYIWDESDARPLVLRYDITTQKSVLTDYRGIYFSPTGRYYHGEPSPKRGTTPEIFDAQNNRPILTHRPRIAALIVSARIVGWASEGDVLILEVNRQDLASETHPHGRLDTVLYDVTHDIARVIEDDSVIGWQNGSAILHDKGKFTKRPLGTIPILPEQAAKPLKLPPSDHLKTSPPPQ